MVYSIGTIKEGISGYVDSVLFPYATDVGASSYLKDTIDSLKRLDSSDKFPANTTLTTMDVMSILQHPPWRWITSH